MRILALESSTTSAKAVLYDSAAGTVTTSSQRFTVDGDDPAVRDPDAIAQQVFALGREHLAGASVDLVTLCSTWHGLTLQSRTGESLTRAYLWPFLGAAGVEEALRADPGFVRWFYGRTGCMVSAIYPALKLKHLADQGLDVTSGLVMDDGSVMFQRLTGQFATTASLASGSGLLNTHDVAWDPEIPGGLGLRPLNYPDLVSSRTHAPLTSQAAAWLGLKAGTPVLAPGPDGGFNQVGDGATTPGIMTLSMGTSGAMRVVADAPKISERQSTWCYRSPDGWLSGAATNGCTNTVDWAREAVWSNADFATIEAQLRPGARDVPTFLPFHFGERCPGWNAHRRGGFVGLEPSHDKVDLYQAVLQGVVFNLLQCFEELVRLNGQPERIKMSGGVLSSPFWTQMTADILGADLEMSEQPNQSSVGALRLGLSAFGEDEEGPGLSSAPVGVARPDARLHDYYRERYARYLTAYDQTTPTTGR